MSVNHDVMNSLLTMRTALLVYLKKPSDQYRLRRYGDIVYFSNRLGYCVLYVNKVDVAEKKATIESLNFVTNVQVSADEDVNLNGTHIEQQIAEMAKAAEAELANRATRGELK